jgi:hypothetical protein
MQSFLLFMPTNTPAHIHTCIHKTKQKQVGSECQGTALNPNELCAVVRVLESLASSGYSVDAQRPLLVPDVDGVLVPASRCFLCTDGALLQRVDARCVYLSSPLLSADVCASIGVRVLSAALEERLDESRGEIMYVRGEGELELTERLVSTEFAQVIESLCAHDSVTTASAHAFLKQFKVRVARTLRTVLLLPSGENVTAEEGAGVMYFVDQVRVCVCVCVHVCTCSFCSCRRFGARRGRFILCDTFCEHALERYSQLIFANCAHGRYAKPCFCPKSFPLAWSFTRRSPQQSTVCLSHACRATFSPSLSLWRRLRALCKPP